MIRKMLLGILFAGAAFGSSIPVTGFGTFSLDSFFDTYANVCFSGSDDSGSVSTCANGVLIGPAPPPSLSASTFNNPILAFYSIGAIIDGVHSDYFAFSIGGEQPGFLKLLDATGNVLMEQDITGYVQITNFQQFGTHFNSNGSLNLNWNGSGSFVVIPTPEAESGLLVGVGFAALLLGRKTAPRQS